LAQRAPGSEAREKEAERYRTLGDLLIISNKHHPSLTLYLPPKQIATGAAFIVAPGGGFQELWITDKGYRIAEWLSQRGIAAFVLIPFAKGAGLELQRGRRSVGGHATRHTYRITKETPPTFLAGGSDRVTASYPEVYRMLKDAGVSVELHIYESIPHGFGIQPTNSSAVSGWPDGCATGCSIGVVTRGMIESRRASV
jgi:acetyl esterase/lipase